MARRFNAVQSLADLDGQAVTALVLDSRQQPEPLPADQLIGHEVHAAALIGLPGRRSCLADLGTLPRPWLSPPDSQACFAVQPGDELLVHEPPFAMQENPEPRMAIVPTTGRQVAKSNAKVGDVPDSACRNVHAICSFVKVFFPIFPIEKLALSGDATVKKPNIPDGARNGENVKMSSGG